MLYIFRVLWYDKIRLNIGRDNIMAETFDDKELDVMEPKMMVNDDLKVIYINEAYEEKLNAGAEEEKAAYEKAQADHPGYVTRLRRMQITVEQMKRFAQIKHDA